MKFDLKKTLGERGQVESYDLIVASFILLIIIGTSAMLWYDQTQTLTDLSTVQRMQLSAANAFNAMLSDTNYLNGGIVNEKNTISRKKLGDFNSQVYATMQQKLGIEQFDFVVKIYNDSNTFLLYGTTGTLRAISLQRVLIMDNNAVKGLFTLYEK